MKDIETYTIDTENIGLKVVISGTNGKAIFYELKTPILSPATRALLDSVKKEMIKKVDFSKYDIFDPDAISSIKSDIKRYAKEMFSIQEKDGAENILVTVLINETLGLGEIEFLLSDPDLEEIIVHPAKTPIRVYHKKHGWLITNLSIQDEDLIKNYASSIARKVGKQITTLDPLLDAHLSTGDRVNAVLYPVSTKGNTITIRKFAHEPWTVTDFINNNTCNSGVFSLIWLAMQYEMNVLISGGTGSGKTSLMNVCMPFIPPNHRIISIEDTRELQLPGFLDWTPLATRLPNPEGEGEITMSDLLVNSLRMRPDRIILGEVRRAKEAETMFEAMHTGHSVYATVHAETVSLTIRRLVNPPINVPPSLLEAVHLNVVMFRDRRRNVRKVYQIGEYTTSESDIEVTVKPNIIYRWVPSSDQIKPHSNSLRFFEDLSRHTGLSQKEINDDIASKKVILDWMSKHNVRKLEEVGKVMDRYYLDPEELQGLIRKVKDPAKVLR